LPHRQIGSMMKAERSLTEYRKGLFSAANVSLLSLDEQELATADVDSGKSHGLWILDVMNIRSPSTFSARTSVVIQDITGYIDIPGS
jgi:hypothetical protein